MGFYVFTIEQVYNDGTLGEYATKSDRQANRKAADILFLDKCSAITKDLSENGHAYAKVWTTNSEGVIVDSREIGTHQEI